MIREGCVFAEAEGFCFFLPPCPPSAARAVLAKPKKKNHRFSTSTLCRHHLGSPRRAVACSRSDFPFSQSEEGAACQKDCKHRASSYAVAWTRRGEIRRVGCCFGIRSVRINDFLSPFLLSARLGPLPPGSRAGCRLSFPLLITGRRRADTLLYVRAVPTT